MINIEPENLKGKTIDECFFFDMNTKVEIRFTDGTRCILERQWCEDEISGERIDLTQLQIQFGV